MVLQMLLLNLLTKQSRLVKTVLVDTLVSLDVFQCYSCDSNTGEKCDDTNAGSETDCPVEAGCTINRGEREGLEGRGRWGAWEVRGGVPALRVIAPSPLAAAFPTPRAGRQLSMAGSHVLQRSEGAELRGQAAAQAVVVKVPARERSTSWG